MTNVSYLFFENFLGCVLSISISETKSGPYIESKLKKNNLNS